MIKLTDLLSEGLGPSSSMIKKIEDFLKKELKVSNIKGKKYSQGGARKGYTFYPEGTKNGLYIDQAYDGIWNIYTVGANGFPINNHWEIKKYEDDIEDEATALNAAFDVIKKFSKTLKESVNEDFTAISNKSGKTVVFKDKDARDAAVKAGTHSDDEESGKEEPKGEKKPNMFSKDAGYDAPDTDKSEPKKDEPKSEPSKYDSEYFADDEKSDSLPMYGYDDDDDDYYYDDEDDGKAGYKKTVERLDKVERALIDDLKLSDNGFSTARSSGGGGGYWEGPLTISSDDVEYDDERFVELAIGSGQNDGNFSIGFTDADGMEVFDGAYSITGDRELSAEEAFKLGKALMKNSDVQKFLKGQISKEEFKTVYDKLASKFGKSTNEGTIKLMNLLRK